MKQTGSGFNPFSRKPTEAEKPTEETNDKKEEDPITVTDDGNTKKDEEITTPASTAEKGGEDTGMGGAFIIVYKVCAMLAAVVLVILTIVSIVDVISFLLSEASQRFKISNDNSFMNNKTTDVRNMKYLLNNPEDEPYSVFLGQRLLVGMIIIIAFAVGLFGLQLAIFLGMKIYAAAQGRKNDDRLIIPFTYLAVLVICFIAALVVNSAYKKDFLERTQDVMKNTKQQMRNVKNYIYSNMSNDTLLLNALKSDDNSTIINILKNNAKNVATLKRMIFTYNMYQYFTRIVIESDPNYETMMQMFTYEGIQKQKVDPTMFLIYQQANFVSDGYTSGLRESIKKSLTTANDINILRDIGITMKELNRRIGKIQNISGGKKSLFTYLWKVMLICIAFVIIVAVIMVLTLAKEYPFVQSFISRMFSSGKNNST